MQNLSFSLAQEFNKLYADVVNCELVRPPYYQGKVPYLFWLSKRRALVEATSNNYNFDTLFDCEEIGDDIFVIGRVAQVVRVYKNNILLAEHEYQSGVQYKFFYTNACKGNALATVVGINGSTSAGELYLDRTAGFTGFDLETWSYIYLNDGDSTSVGVGQSFSIDAITNNRVTVTSSGWAVSPVAATGKIYSDFSEVLSYVAGDYIYTINGYEEAMPDMPLPVKAVENPIDAIASDGRLIILNRKKNIFATYGGFNSLYVSGKGYIGSQSDAVNLVEFQQYVLVLGTSQLKCITSVDYTYSVDGTTVTETRFSLSLVTRSTSLFKQGSFTVYNQGLYIVSRNKQFVAVTIQSVGINKYVVQEQNQGIFIQKFLDNLDADYDQIGITITDMSIFLVVSDNQETKMFIYDIFYQWWHRWEFGTKISRMLPSGKFLGYTVLQPAASNKDIGKESFKQKISLVVGEDAYNQLKRLLFLKMNIGEDTTENAMLSFQSFLNGTSETYNKVLGSAEYFEKIKNGSTEGLFMDSLNGGTLFLNSFETSYELAPYAQLEIPTWFFYDVCIINLTASESERIQFGGCLIGYDLYEPAITPAQNVI